MFRLFVGLVALLFLSGCATDITIGVPYAHVDTPDTSGKKGFGFALGLAPTKQIELADDAQARPPNTGTVEKSAAGDLYGKLYYGLMGPLDFGVSYGADSGMWAGVLKLQLIGSSIAENKPGFLFGIHGRYGVGGDKESGDQRQQFGPGGYPWRAKGEVGLKEGGGSFGWRTSGDVMFFLGGAYADYDGELTIDQDLSATADSPEAHYNTKYEGYSVSAALGFRLRNNLTISAVGSEFHWTGLQRIQDIQGWVEYAY